jgi:Leucine-rich repeat (LRR) protein
MKKLLLLLIIPFLSFGQDLTYVPDDTFEQLLITAGYDDVMDNYVLTSNINTISSITLYPTLGNYFYIDGVSFLWGNFDEQVPPIFDLTGIQDFTLLQDLSIPSHYLSSIDLSGLFYLQNVNISENYLECIDLTGCVSLSTLYLNNNFLEYIDISTCISLTGFDYAVNPFLECIELGDNPSPIFQVYIDFPNPNDSFEVDCDYPKNECSSSSVTIIENTTEKDIFKIIDILGRETTNNKGFQLHIYDDGSVEKKYLIK